MSKGLYTVIFLLIILGGCATKELVKNVSDEGALKERVMAYSNYRINEQFDKSYEYEDPIYRKANNLSRYIRRMTSGTLKWLKADIKNIQIRDDTASVDLNLRVKVFLMPQASIAVVPKVLERDSEVNEKWIKVDGAWYHVFK